MHFSKNLLLPAVAVVLLSSLFASTAIAELVTYQFTGRTQATVGNSFGNRFFSDAFFEILLSIDDDTADQFPNQDNRGAFSGATTTLSIPAAEINNAVSTNVTGILQEDFGSTRFRLVDPNNFFGSAALGLGFNTSVIPDADSINPFNDPTPAPSNFEGGLQWQFLLGPNVTFNSVHEVSVSNFSTAGVPEPTSFTMFAIGLLAVSFKRRRR